MVDNEGRRTGDRVRLTKIATPPGGIIACPPGLYQPGLWAGILTLPLGHVLEGYLLADLIRGHPLRLRVLARHGMAARAQYTSARILRLHHNRAVTCDSIYLVETIANCGTVVAARGL